METEMDYKELEKQFKSNIDLLEQANDMLALEIKEKEKIERELTYTRNLLDTILENLPAVVWAKDAETYKFTYLNKYAENTINYYSKDVIGKSVSDMFPPEEAEQYNREDDEVIKNGSMLDIKEQIINTRNEGEKVFFTRKVLVRDEEGKPKLIIGISSDITEFKKAQLELCKSEQKFSTLFHASPVAVTVERMSDNVILEANASFLELTGYKKREVIGKSALDLAIVVDPEARQKMIEYVKKYRKLRNREVVIRTKTGELRHMLQSVEYIQLDGEEPCLMVMGQDITNLKEAEEEMVRALSKEKDLNLLKTRFISMISHEFRTPLTSIMLSAELLKNFGDRWNTEEKNKHFNRIMDTVRSMSQLMEDVLTIGRMESGKFDFEPEEVHLQEFCSSLVENIKLNTANEIVINTELKTNRNVVKVDRKLLWLALSNLLSNAVKYSDKSKEVDFKVISEDGNIVFRVKDNGIGIPSKDHEHLFKTFFRASNVGTISGYGLGLSIVKKCVDVHNGRIEVKSRENEGTTFNIIIPGNNLK